MIIIVNDNTSTDETLIRETVAVAKRDVAQEQEARSWSVYQEPIALSDLDEVSGIRYLCDLSLRKIANSSNLETKSRNEDELLKNLLLLETAKYRAANGQTSPAEDLDHATKRIEDMLVQKNREYGSAVFKKNNVFSPLTREQAIRVRLDDKLERLANQMRKAKHEIVEDTEFDVAGYLILMRVASRKAG